jgi:DNA invertase Pin-like site-specific DNA recombinase
MKRAATYLRVSTKEQAEKGGRAEGFSIPAQREALHRKAQSLGAVIVAEFVDAGESAKSADRPDLQRMLAYLAENRVDYVLVHKVDRLARNRVDDIEITMAIKKSGAQLVSATENIDETPSGMLLHGIMSSIAEFYSSNLATEVHKGMGQKVKTGGTPGKAPLGYVNVGRITSEGREERTVVVDPERAPLLSWAFSAFATGEWTLRSQTDELELRGLLSRKTPQQPSRPLRLTVLHSILTNPYYKGVVMYRGVAHQGKHTPLVDPATWQQVQDVLTAHAGGEKQREHLHYLKSSVYCGDCESRLMISNAKNRHGVTYPYFVCLGRHKKLTRCTRKAMLIATVEDLVEEHWATIQLDASNRKSIENYIRKMLSAQRQDEILERKALEQSQRTLLTKREKLIEAVYSGAMPMELIAREQETVSRQLTDVEGRLASAATNDEQVELTLTGALDLLQNCHNAYLAAGPQVRRLLNQALFTRLYIDEDDVHADYAAPFGTLLGPEILSATQAEPADSGTDRVTVANVMMRSGETNGKIPEERSVLGDLSARIFRLTTNFEGSNKTALAALRRSLSNPERPLLQVFQISTKYIDMGCPATKFDTRSAIIAQSGSSDPATVRLRVKPNHRLSPAEIDRMVQANKAGTSQAKLAKRFHVHVETVNRHLRRRRQALKLGCVAIRYLTPPVKGVSH